MRSSTSSGKLTASALVRPGPSYVASVDMIGPTCGSAVLTIWDSANASTAGKLILAEVQVDAGMPSCNHVWHYPINANQGIYAELTGDAGAFYIVQYVAA